MQGTPALEMCLPRRPASNLGGTCIVVVVFRCCRCNASTEPLLRLFVTRTLVAVSTALSVRCQQRTWGFHLLERTSHLVVLSSASRHPSSQLLSCSWLANIRTDAAAAVLAAYGLIKATSEHTTGCRQVATLLAGLDGYRLRYSYLANSLEAGLRRHDMASEFIASRHTCARHD